MGVGAGDTLIVLAFSRSMVQGGEIVVHGNFDVKKVHTDWNIMGVRLFTLEYTDDNNR